MGSLTCVKEKQKQVVINKAKRQGLYVGWFG